MNSKKILASLVGASILLLASCSGLHSGHGGGGGGTTNAHVTITMFDTPPAGLTLLSFTLPIAGISLVPSSGSAIPISSIVSSVEATRLQTDSVLLASDVSITPGTYSLSVSLGPTTATAGVFVNSTGSSITYTLSGSNFTCANNAVCNLPAGAIATIPISGTFTLGSGSSQWIGLNLDLTNAITTSGGLSVDFTQSGVLSMITAVRTGLPSGAADTLEDFTGVVTAYTANSSITVQNGVTGQKLTATLNSSTEYDIPLGTYDNCTASTSQGCLAVGSTVSIDMNVNSVGVLTATEVDVLDATAVDEVEGVIYPTTNTNVFGLILADKVSASGNSVLGASTTTWGTPILLNVNSVNNFAVDAKTLSSQFTGEPAGFGAGQLLAGQQVRAQVTSIASGASGITATATNMLLRFSRLTGTAVGPGANTFNFTPPAYISTAEPQLSPYPAQTFSTTLYDGTTQGNIPASTIAIRALMLDSTSPTFAVAKVRVP